MLSKQLLTTLFVITLFILCSHTFARMPELHSIEEADPKLPKRVDLLPKGSSASKQKGHMHDLPVKSSWPDLVGRHGDEAVAEIKREDPSLKVFKVPQGSMVTMDFDTHRVRVWVDKDGKVVGAPRTG